MRVRKRNGASEPVDVNKIVRAVSRCCVGLAGRRRDARRDQDDQRPLRRRDHARARSAVDPDRRGAHRRGAGVRQARGAPAGDRTSTRRCATRRSTPSRSRSPAAQRLGLVNDRLADFVAAQRPQAQRRASSPSATASSSTSACARVYDRYLLQAPADARWCIETPQHFFLRVACALSETVGGGARALPAVLVARVPAELADAVQRRHAPRAALELLPARLARRPPGGDLRALHRRRDALEVLRRHRPRLPPRALARLADRGTNGHSNGIVPWLKTLDASVAAVNQGGKRKGACCVYLETWHADIEEFLELRDNTGDEARRTHNLNLANWIPDLFMRARRGGRRLDPVRSQGRARRCPICTARSSSGAYVEAEARGAGGARRSRRASSTRG